MLKQNCLSVHHPHRKFEGHLSLFMFLSQPPTNKIFWSSSTGFRYYWIKTAIWSIFGSSCSFPKRKRITSAVPFFAQEKWNDERSEKWRQIRGVEYRLMYFACDSLSEPLGRVPGQLKIGNTWQSTGFGNHQRRDVDEREVFPREKSFLLQSEKKKRWKSKMDPSTWSYE